MKLLYRYNQVLGSRITEAFEPSTCGRLSRSQKKSSTFEKKFSGTPLKYSKTGHKSSPFHYCHANFSKTSPRALGKKCVTRKLGRALDCIATVCPITGAIKKIHRVKPSFPRIWLYKMPQRVPGHLNSPGDWFNSDRKKPSKKNSVKLLKEAINRSKMRTKKESFDPRGSLLTQFMDLNAFKMNFPVFKAY